MPRSFVPAVLLLAACCAAPLVDAPPADDRPAVADPGPADVDPIDPRPDAPGALRQVALLKASNGTPGDNFGLSVAIAGGGGTIAVGALREDGAGGGIDNDPGPRDATDSGAVYVFRKVDGAWLEEAYIKPDAPAPFAGFGFSTSLSADGAVLAVGAIRATVGDAPAAGRVYLYFRGLDGWELLQEVTAPAPAPEDFFGWSVSLSADGDRLAVSALQEDGGGRGPDPAPTTARAADSGAAYVFDRIDGRFAHTATLKASNADAGDAFGMSLALSADGRTLAVGAGGERSAEVAHPEDDGLPGAGAVYILQDRAGAWEEVAFLKAANAAAAAQFGTSVAIDADGDTVVVGAIGDGSGPPDGPTDTRFANSGAVYVYRSLGWPGRQAATVKPAFVRANTAYGRSVGVTGDGGLIAVGASWEHSDATGVDGDAANQRAGFSGAAWLRAEDGGDWPELHYVKPSNTAPNQNFGANVAMSSAGRTLVVGAPGESSAPDRADGVGDDAPKSGAVFVFER